MSIQLPQLVLADQSASRRGFMRAAGTATLSATAVALLAGCSSSMAKGGMAKSDPASDAGILNVALGLEYEAIMAYQIAAESGLVTQQVLPVAVTFQNHHKEHAAALEAAVRKLGGTPVSPKSKTEVARAINAASLRNQTDVLMLAARLEQGAANAYLGAIPAFADKDISQAAGRIAADETMHWTVLAQALGQPLPAKAFAFGA